MERSQDLEMFRERFLDQLHASRPSLHGHQQFVQYWKLIEREAQQTEELGKLESWVKDLARDRDRVRALKDRLEARKDTDQGAAALLQLVRQILEMLDDIQRKLKVRRDDRRRVLGWLLLAAGPGVKKKVPEEKPGEGQKKGEDKKVSEQVLTKPKDPEEKKKPTKQMTR
ncbi:MAG: hypothetical protein EP329_14555 [Deltaproteobacteria bacterium]|nr:MAG: hypothetical protein EP329_14555 [Deltaproteobacteria bacterium]